MRLKEALYDTPETDQPNESPTHAWVYYTHSDPLGFTEGSHERMLQYAPASEASKAVGVDGYRVVWDTGKGAKYRGSR